MSQIERVSRRGFVGRMFTAGTLVLGAKILPLDAEAAVSAGEAWLPSVYLGLSPTGLVTIVAHRSEMGTGIRSVLPMLLADELEADWKQVKVAQAIGDAKYGDQNTDGSCSIRDFYDTIRAAGAIPPVR